MPLPLSLAQLAQQYEQAGLQMYGQEPDVSGLQEFARQRSQEGNSAALNALAAQFAGQDFQPMQAQFLKQAAAAQEPMKVGNAGYITPKGEFVKDPTYQNDRRAEVLLRQGQSYRDLDAANARDAANRESRAMIASMRGNSGDDARVWRGEDALRKSFETATKELSDTITATERIDTILAPFANQPLTNIPSVYQQSLVILLNKFLDPNSVVREGEFDRVVQAQGLVGRAKNFLDNIASGKPLDANTITQIGSLGKLYQQAARSKMGRTASQYRDIATRRGFNPMNVLPEQFLGGPGGAPGGGNQSDPLGLLGGG
jgi:hypothetical protein